MRLIATAVALGISAVGCGGGAGGTADEKAGAADPSAVSGTPLDATASETASPTPSPTPTWSFSLSDDEDTAEAGERIVIAVLDNDTVTSPSGATEGLDLDLTVDAVPGHGTATVDGARIAYRPTAGYSGPDEFTYRVKPQDGGTAGTAVVRINVTAPPPVSYRNCDAARAAGAAPVHRGDPGYGSHLDRDGDGVGCEPYSGSSGGSTGGSNGGSSSGGSSSGGSGGVGSTYYKNCDAARAAGAAPVHRGDPGYGSHLDRDGDGVGCE
ncbi:excalibur calcium-binding domain-containing protein [Streptomyces sp. MUM 178J]|uniref:excalibur calcium-binding domain-containing protein n=1 Tax=Streptomyces sp. MUM 178J TaxID=2791991 RepID=UPI001F037334|nr:excalibur calcium-binding domain-containing protein [Streptomyces sp. MUM 178J]WRQ79589.1 excalibur calcium-binding domain-containing protein [Streptomyces sp. MUM 178J]